MDCIDSTALREEDLIKYVLDNAPLPGEVKGHLQHCMHCQRKLAHYQHAEKYLISKLYRQQCPDTMALNKYCAGWLTVDEVMEISEHLKDCPLCMNEVKTIRQTLASFELFPGTHSSTSPQMVVRRIIATLLPWQPQLVMRSDNPVTASSKWPRQYQAEEINISLHLSRTSGGEMMLLGLFSSDDPEESVENFEGIPVDLYRANNDGAGEQDGDWLAGDPLLNSSVDDLGNLAFKAIPAGEYVMVVHLPTRELIIKGLMIEHGW